jgi:LPPG:FO 2-phospho-L-lactate transferase
LAQGVTKTEVTKELCERWDVKVRLLPVTDDPLATVFDTEHGVLSFQEYFVRRHHDVTVHAISVEGASEARATPEVLNALRTSSRIVIAPSNPLISIDPILQVPEIRDLVRERRADVVAVSPIINGAALKGPADRLLRELGHAVTCEGVARFYRDLADTFIIDQADRPLSTSIQSLGMRVHVTTTIMSNPEHAAALAKKVLE